MIALLVVGPLFFKHTWMYGFGFQNVYSNNKGARIKTKFSFEWLVSIKN